MEWDSNKAFSMKGEKYKKILKKLSKRLDKNNINNNLESILKYGLFEHKMPKFCFAPWEMAFINSRGDVLACCTLASLYENVLGNVREKSFKEIWFGKRMDQFRERIRKNILYEECKKCLPEITESYNKVYKEMKRIRVK